MMVMHLGRWSLAALGALALMWPCRAHAQGTDAYRNYQLFPIVVDSASFSQRFTFRTSGTVNLNPVFFRAEQNGGFNQVPCPQIEVVGNRSIASLRELCPSLPAGTQYGMLGVAQLNNAGPGFSGFSRVSNPQGQGFSVEAFGVEQFSSSEVEESARVLGIRRLAATAGSPAIQTNCFYGVAPKFSNTISNLQPVQLNIFVFPTDGSPAGFAAKTAYPGTLYRLLDVFGALGMPAGDVQDAVFRVDHDTSLHETAWPIVAFCTVQDNTSFGADFRIGKHLIDDSGTERFTQDTQEMPMPSGYFPRNFEIDGGRNWAVTHVIYFRHPDRISCALLDVNTNQVLSPSYGLEMRLVEGDGVTVVAGGNNVVSFSDVYLGDKPGRNQGSTGRYTIQVEGDYSFGDSTDDRFYDLRCTSGSGHTHADIIREQQANRF